MTAPSPNVQPVIDSVAAEAAIHWDRLADDEERMAAYNREIGIDSSTTSPGDYRARDYRRCAASLRLEATTGKPHCQRCLCPLDEHLGFSHGVLPGPCKRPEVALPPRQPALSLATLGLSLARAGALAWASHADLKVTKTKILIYAAQRRWHVAAAAADIMIAAQVEVVS